MSSTDFIPANWDLFVDKVNIRPVSGPALNWWQDLDANMVKQALAGTRAWLRGGASWYGLTPVAADPAPGGLADYVWLKTDKTLWYSHFDGTTRTATAIGGGGGGGSTSSGGLTGAGAIVANATSIVIAAPSADAAKGVQVWGYDLDSAQMDPHVFGADIVTGTGFTIRFDKALGTERLYWRT